MYVHGIYKVYSRYIHGICYTYTIISIISVLPAFKEAMDVGGSGNACTQHGISGHKRNCTQKSCFTTRQDIPGIYQVYTMHIPCESHVLAFLFAHPRLEASDLDFLRIFSVLATERPPTRGWGRPKFHNQVLIL